MAKRGLRRHRRHRNLGQALDCSSSARVTPDQALMLPGYYPLSNAWTPRERLLGLAFTALAAFNVFFVLSPRPAQSTAVLDFWATAKYIDLTHSIEPSMPVWEAFAQPSIGAALAGKTAAPIINATDEFTYGMQGFIATQVTLTTDQLGTQLDPPAHWNEYGATISDVPPTVALRPLVVVDITTSVKADPAYAAQVSDVEAWEASHGRVPYGSVVLFRSDWSKGWGKPSDVTDYPGVSLARAQVPPFEARHLGARPRAARHRHDRQSRGRGVVDAQQFHADRRRHEYALAPAVWLPALDRVPEDTGRDRRIRKISRHLPGRLEVWRDD